MSKGADCVGADLTGADLLLAARTCYGWLLACAPRRMIRLGTPQSPGPRTVTMTRVLGARHLLQALLTAAARAAGMPPGAALAAGAAVDTLHAASMVGLAVVYRPLRHVALADAALESGLAAFGATVSRRR